MEDDYELRTRQVCVTNWQFCRCTITIPSSHHCQVLGHCTHHQLIPRHLILRQTYQSTRVIWHRAGQSEEKNHKISIANAIFDQKPKSKVTIQLEPYFTPNDNQSHWKYLTGLKNSSGNNCLYYMRVSVVNVDVSIIITNSRKKGYEQIFWEGRSLRRNKTNRVRAICTSITRCYHQPIVRAILKLVLWHQDIDKRAGDGGESGLQIIFTILSNRWFDSDSGDCNHPSARQVFKNKIERNWTFEKTRIWIWDHSSDLRNDKVKKVKDCHRHTPPLSIQESLDVDVDKEER